MSGCKIRFDTTQGAESTPQEWKAVQELKKNLEKSLKKQGLDSDAILRGLANAKSGSELSRQVDKILDQIVQNDAKGFARSSARRIANEAKFVQNSKLIDQAIAKGTNAGKAVNDLMFSSALGHGLSLEQTAKTIGSQWIGDKLSRRLDALLGDTNRLARDPALRDDVIRAYQRIHLGQTPEKGLASDVAKVMYDIRREQLAKFNSLGGNKPLAASGLPRLFDWTRIQGNREDFVKTLSEALDPATHGSLADRQAIAATLFQTMQDHNGMVDWDEVGQKLGQDVAPVLNYARGDAWKTMNDKFGSRNFYETYLKAVENTRSKQAQLTMFGPDADRGVSRLIDYARDKGASAQSLVRARSRWEQQSRMWTPEYQRLSRYLGLARTVKTGAALGQAILGSLSDPVVLTYAMKQFVGSGVLDSIGKILSSGGKESMQACRYLGAFGEGMTSHISNRFGLIGESGDRVSSMAAKTTDMIMRASGIELFTGMMKRAGMRILDRHIGQFLEQGTKFDQLPANLQFQLQRFQIGPKEWASLGKEHLDQNGDFNVFKVEPQNTTGIDLRTRLSAFYDQMIRNGVLRPGLADRELLNLGFTPGRVQSEIAKTLSMFQSFSVAAHRRIIYASAMNPSISATSKLTGLSALFTMGLIAGGISVQARQVLAGNQPYDWTSPEFIAKSIAQLPYGRVIGLIVDAAQDALSDVTGAPSQGGAQLSAGPLAEDIYNGFAGILKTGEGLIQGNEEKVRKNLSREAQILLSEVPGQSLPGVAAIWRSLIVNNVQDMIDPRGYRQQQQTMRHEARQNRLGGELRSFIGQGLDNLTQ